MRAGRLSVSRALERLRHLPFEDLGFAKIDHHRGVRQGFAEVIYARGKTPRQVSAIVSRMLRPASQAEHSDHARERRRFFAPCAALTRQAQYHELSGAISIRRNSRRVGKGTILVVTAGTSDIPVAEEAAVTAEIMGNQVETIYDVGVAGLHRLLAAPQRLAVGARHHLRRGNGRRAAERRRRFGRRAGDRGSNQRGLWREFWWAGGAAGDAEQLRLEHLRRQHR